MTTINFLGGCREVGRSAVMVDGIMIDYGVKPSDPPEFPLNGLSPRAVILSHGHLDHIGVAPNLMYYDPEVILTPPSHELSMILLRDSMKIMHPPPFTKRELRQFESNIREVEYEEPITVGDYEVEFFNAGHIPGSASIHMRGDVNILYSGDIRLEETRLLEGANTDYPETDILIVESTYFGTEHPDRKELERAFVESVIDTLDMGGHAIIPAFAVGRTQEVLMILERYGITPYVDGMGKEVAQVIQRHPDFIRSPKELKRAVRNAIPVEWRQRERVLEEPSAVVTTAGMLNGGPAMFYISRLYNDEKSKILLTGYQVEGTNGDMALKTGMLNLGTRVVKLKMGVEQYDFSAHADDRQLKEYVKRVVDRGAEVVFTIHGEETEAFAEWIKDNIGVEAYAPKNGEIYVI
ncbi:MULTISPECIES: MBL fold metallo-hydrolase [Archaeoglobus]|jgi:putative mRNA 3-end processing factor|uniref:mRNA 3'-end processing factor, putative n=3 Tax=Archaeoglobus fulgidus TaxID=2234 RepID=O29718_ARCFU|nr:MULTISPECIES: MBL fold metallo-hydrolase [Archaeoglobus]AAB90702.1 mRNA 3'-end processing factor, putative [Archaeoglobus fulgidus DSM 4304]AIG97349.1 putative exonuclease of the beta-lactamase fold protein involved in RNA processing [Archaeoglobus fulgidus DSM 8774]KUJ93577.1 MAG: mRNA 3'-end processing factor, putative [Archaeoglobus fulgidus]KUK07162.1 MAG: mRNA 3'-end processing factor, putative [Archaeoglobus fulgidus]MDI3496948.1 putative mRNA 3-end processing factor [Archaeoglobus sp